MSANLLSVEPSVTVVTINRNNEAGLQRTLRSVAEQTFDAVEHIVVDGASTDGSVAALRAAKVTTPRLHWISERDSGVFEAQNKGIRLARAPYILFLNSGDHLVDSSALKEAVAEIGACDLHYFDLDLQPGSTTNIRSTTKRYPDRLDFSYFAIDSLPHPATFIRRSLFERFGSYDESLRIVADWKAFLLWVCRHNCSYQHHARSLSVFYLDGVSSRQDMRSAQLDERARVLESEFPAFVHDIRLFSEARDAIKTLESVRRSRWVCALQSIGLLWRF